MNSPQQVLDQFLASFNVQQFYEAYCVLDDNRELFNEHPVLKYLYSIALHMLGSRQRAHYTLREYCDAYPHDAAANELLRQIEKEFPTQMTLFPLQRVSSDAVRPIDQLLREGTKKGTSEAIPQSDIILHRICGPYVVRPYGVVVWEDGTIVAESIKEISTTDVFHSILMIRENGDPEPFPVASALLLTGGPQDKDSEIWLENFEWQLVHARTLGFSGAVVAPVQFAHVKECLDRFEISSDRRIGAEEMTIAAGELWMFERLK